MRGGVDEPRLYSQVLNTCHSERSEESAVRGSVQEEILIPSAANNRCGLVKDRASLFRQQRRALNVPREMVDGAGCRQNRRPPRREA